VWQSLEVFLAGGTTAVEPPWSSSRPGDAISLCEFVAVAAPAPARTTAVSWDWRRPWIAAVDDGDSGGGGGLGPSRPRWAWMGRCLLIRRLHR
jgi:hypothetical protein